MVRPQQTLSHPFGITTFGSSVLRVDPDLASVKFSVIRVELQPKDAFEAAQTGAKAVQSYLKNSKIKEFGSSRINLDQSWKHSGTDSKFLGYKTTIDFHLILRDLTRVEEILVGITNAGAHNINSINYQTSRLKELRADARQKAVQAALEKAQMYCDAAGVGLGAVIHIEDVNPDQLRGYNGHVGYDQMQQDEDENIQAFNPSSIIVGGAVMIACKIKSK